jgi:hypothetical protein
MMNATTITMQKSIDFVVDSMENTAMLLGVIQENAVSTNNAQIIEAYAEVIDRIGWMKEALVNIAVFVRRIPEIAQNSTNPFVMKAYAEVLRDHYSTESISKFSKLYGESLSWEDEEYNEYSKLLDYIGMLRSEDLHSDFCRICRYMLNWYSRHGVETIADKPWSTKQVSISYLFDNIGWLFANADLNK